MNGVLLEEKTINGFKISKDSVDGVSITSPNGHQYHLVEGISYLGKSTSDIIFIMKSDPEDGYTGLVNFTFSATFEEEDNYQNCIEYIKDYESGKTPMLSKILD